MFYKSTVEPAEPWYALHAYGTQSGQNFAEKETISKNFNLSKTKPKIQVQFFLHFLQVRNEFENVEQAMAG